ncbi:MAG TPA: DUF368 domain-containing protein [Candidatus Rikenella faecigallinarum]|uniref:DUF368 domain-containing protein n=1 Tax=Candidatus Rikenella faecigallinarum TaxID=2838745 RepID=A0A9D1TYB1_9BACT|nr:DUF368 domain-containing protein [Candidatus Rikenella faecigallinarum]
MKEKRNYLMLVLKGIGMGAADVIPGVSGGTIAFITGIYEELIGSIRSFDLTALRQLLRLDLRCFWKHVNGNFLVSVLLGIGISIFSLAKLMQYLLENHPIFVWSFFFGLIIASSWLVAREVKRWSIGTVISLVVGVAAAYVITVLNPVQTLTNPSWWFIILSGAVAICAMILPGISGAFILLLMGMYSFVIGAVSTFQWSVLLLFAVGAVAGIISFSHLLSWLLEKFHGLTVALLTGFMLGSLNKIWPWKETLEYYMDSHGVQQPLVEQNILPSTYAQVSGEPALLGWAIVFMAVGFFLIWGIEKAAAVLSRKRETAK